MSLKFTIVRSDRNYDFWFSYTNFHLKQLCESYGLPSTGSKKDKAARLCFAYEMGYEASNSPKLAEKIRKKELLEKLTSRSPPLPDPASIPTSDWKNDHNALATVPLVEWQNIVNYYLLEPFAAPSDLGNFNK